MEVLRVPPYPITTTWNLPDNNYAYIVYVEDLVDHSVEETTITSSSSGVVTYTVPAEKVQFDRQFLIRFYDAEREHIIQESNLDIVRPYVNPLTLATSGTASEIAEYKMWELIARSLIDTYTDIGFYNHKSILQVEGNGLDYMPVWRDANRILKVYDNNVLVFNGQDRAISVADFYDEDPTSNPNLGLVLASDHGFEIGDSVEVVLPEEDINGTYGVTEIIDSTTIRISLSLSSVNGLSGTGETVKRVWANNFRVTLDNSAIVKEFTGYTDVISVNYPKMPVSRGDYVYDAEPYGTFAKGHDFLFVLDEGFRAIPADVEYATTMLINDLKCGKLDYYQKYVTSYNTDQFRIQFDKKMLEGTGNLLVDKILDKYMKSITKVGVL
jgi:hypothetical protein